MNIPKCPPPPEFVGPNPGVCLNGQVLCNNPVLFDGKVVGYCDHIVWPPQLQGRWFRRPGHPGKAHRLQWWTA